MRTTWWRRRGAGRRGGERGSATPLLALLVLAAGGLVLGLGRMGGTAVEAAAARTAADAAALAGAAGGRLAAEDLAAANGGRLVELREEGDEVEVVVEVGDARARARARRIVTPAPFPAVGTAGRAGLQPGLQAALAEAERLLGVAVPITSGYRSPAQQQALWDRRASNPYPVARPGTSPHERGIAVDVPLAFVPRLRTVAGRAGLCQPLPTTDPVHFELCRPSRG